VGGVLQLSVQPDAVLQEALVEQVMAEPVPE